MQKVYPFLMFQNGQAEAAMNFYTTLIADSEITKLTKYGPDEPGDEGTVMQAVFSIKGQKFMCIDSNINHEFTFTPAISIYLNCDTEEELAHYYEHLLQDGQALMPVGNYGFSQKFAWVNDRYGVSWQLNLA